MTRLDEQSVGVRFISLAMKALGLGLLYFEVDLVWHFWIYWQSHSDPRYLEMPSFTRRLASSLRYSLLSSKNFRGGVTVVKLYYLPIVPSREGRFYTACTRDMNCIIKD